jgi:biopolymer transport protein ExbD
MKLDRREIRVPQETIIALIDVVFFLLVFFMIVGRIDSTTPFEIVPPVSMYGTELPRGGGMLAVGRYGQIAIDGADVARSTVVERLEGRLAEQPDIQIRLNAHREAALRHILPLVGKLEAAGASNIVLVVTPNTP